jgi:hypothetical protein
MNIPGNIREHFVSSVDPNDYSVAVPTFNVKTSYDPNQYTTTIDSITEQSKNASDADLAAAQIDADYLTQRLIEETKQSQIAADDAADYRANQTKLGLAYQDNVKAGIKSNDTRAADTQSTFRKVSDNAASSLGSNNNDGGDSDSSSGGGSATMPPRESLLSGLSDLLAGIMKFVLLVALFGGLVVCGVWTYQNREIIGAYLKKVNAKMQGKLTNSAPQEVNVMPKYRNSREPAI